ncbi:MAG: GIY-YIG nuclease family protein [Prevotella sp.]|nr:GIY-YIG nuclease family protein [Prevotella sp.]
MANELIKSYSLNFEGYWREINKNGIPAKSGVYLVYRCVYDAKSNTVGLKDIIYIGQAENLHDRIAGHEKLSDFKTQLQRGEELCYSVAQIPITDLDIVENALIFAQKPELNDNLKNTFNHGAVSMKLDGRCACMKYTDFKIS